MRQIKFRAQDIASNKWLYGDLRYHKDDVCIFEQDGNKGEQVKRDTIGQFVGLKDKNGKEIYEGDILLWTRKNVHIEGRPIQDFSDKCIIYYDNDKCSFRFRCKLDCGSCVGNLDFSDDRAKESYIEVIGNIHDNPELIYVPSNKE